MKDYIEIHQDFIYWEHFNDFTTTRIFFHLLLSCDHKFLLKTKKAELIYTLQLTSNEIDSSLDKLESTGWIKYIYFDHVLVVLISENDLYKIPV